MRSSAHGIRFLILTAALACIGFFGASILRVRWLDATTVPAPAAALALDHTADLVAGPPNAPATVRIFGDYECPACRALDRALGDTLLALAAARRIRLVYLHRPLASRRDADVAAAAVACAPTPAERWRFHRQLYLLDPPIPPHTPAPLARRARSLGAGDSTFLGCVGSDTMRTHASRAIAAARAAGFHEVPTVLVDDEHVRFRTHGALLRHITRTIDRSTTTSALPHR